MANEHNARWQSSIMLIGKVVYGYLKRHPCLPSENLLLTPVIRVRPVAGRTRKRGRGHRDEDAGGGWERKGNGSIFI